MRATTRVPLSRADCRMDKLQSTANPYYKQIENIPKGMMSDNEIRMLEYEIGSRRLLESNDPQDFMLMDKEYNN